MTKLKRSPTGDLGVEGLTFRPIEPGDEPLLCSIYASTRGEDMALVPHWTEDEKFAFLLQQFEAQHNYYKHQYQAPDFRIILCEGVPAGRLYLDRRPDDIRIVDITLLPDYRNHGYGEYILRQILEEAIETNKSVSIHVERANRALQLYDRLGFNVAEESHPVYLLLRWIADVADNPDKH